MQTPNPVSQRTVEAVTVPTGPDVLPRLLPALAAALDAGPAVLPLPERPAPVRDALLAALDPHAALEDDPADPVALVVPTSGSSGEPKGVLVGAAAVRASADATHARLGGPGSWLLAVPATHIAGLMVLARSVVAGTEPVALDLRAGFDPESFAAASVRLLGAARGRRYTALVPTQLAAILDAGGCPVEALCAYDAVLLGGSAAAPELVGRGLAAGVRLVATYGMTETCGGCVYDGEPLDGVKVEIDGGDVIRLAGPVLARGYRLRPDLTGHAFDHGWFTTSDTGRFDPDGRLRVLGRTDEVAISGGVKVPLAAVDAAVADHPAVATAAAVALPDPRWGQRVVVVAVASDPSRPPTLASVRAHVAAGQPPAYVPKELVVVETLPMLPSGKIDRRALTARLLETPIA